MRTTSTNTGDRLYDVPENTQALAEAADWSAPQSEELYHVRRWGDEYFSVNEAGHVVVKPVRGADLSIDLYEVVEQLKERGIAFPALIRFQDLLKSRVEHLNEAFRGAISASGFRGAYHGVYPVKVNQLREVVEEILVAGAPYEYGLECGSKSELVATLPYLDMHDALLICNGCKDRAMYRLILAGQRLRRRVLPVIERAEEVDMLLAEAQRAEITAGIGVRVRLTTAGAGLWSESGGENSKFGLSLTELVELMQRQKAEDLPFHVELLHFHLGSQIADLANVRDAVREAARIYAWMRAQGRDVTFLDVGGGLGVSYEAGNPDALGTINYTLDEYAAAVVDGIGRICDEEGVPHPTIVSESGRAVTAHHSVLIVEAIGSRRKDLPETVPPADGESSLLDSAYQIYSRLHSNGQISDVGTLDGLLARTRQLRAEMLERFRKGDVSVEEKGALEGSYWAICVLISRRLRSADADELTPALAALEHQLADHYLCNFSIFRSMVDHWAIGQRFPIMPIHRLDEVPRRRGILVDLTCDSDGKVNTFVSPEGDKRYLELHEMRPGDPYYLGAFLMGAYQDIMGDMHNLFGRVTEAHVYADEQEPGNFYVEEMLRGATVEEQLALVQYYPNDLERRMGELIHREVKGGRLRPKEGVKLLNQYRQLFQHSTYLATEETF